MSEGTIGQRLEELTKKFAALQSEINALNELTGNTEAIRNEEIYGDPNFPNLFQHCKSVNKQKSPVPRSLRSIYIDSYCQDEEIEKARAEIRVFAEFMSLLILNMQRRKAIPAGLVAGVADIYFQDMDEAEKELASEVVNAIESMYSYL